MANNVKNISTVKPSVQGAIWIGGAEAAVPTTATGELAGFECLGTVSEDGVKRKSQETPNPSRTGAATPWPQFRRTMKRLMNSR